MTGAQRRHCATVLLIVASAFWWHRWIPALLLASVVSWAVFHGRLEEDPGSDLGRRWRRAWPASTMALVFLLLAGTVAYSISDEPITPEVLPIALNIAALAIILCGDWWTRLACRRRGRTAAGESRAVASSGVSPVAPASSRA